MRGRVLARCTGSLCTKRDAELAALVWDSCSLRACVHRPVGAVPLHDPIQAPALEPPTEGCLFE